jgi:protein-disulfide isomerase-like protein with CxxC motif
LTRDVAGTLEVMAEIEIACGLKFTAIVNNTNLGKHTTAEDILESDTYAKAVSEATGLPIKMTTVNHTLLQKLPEGNFFPLHLQELYYEIKTEDALWQN